MSKIEWTEQTWNPIIGCSKVSPGCANCYAEKMAFRQKYMRPQSEYSQVTTRRKWNGKTAFVESQLDKPLKRQKPTTYFACSMGDLFHESVPFEWVDKVFAVMALCPQHTFQVLTKRPARMAYYLSCYYPHDSSTLIGIRAQIHKINPKAYTHSKFPWPLPNVWLGTTTENQAMADKRIPYLKKCPAAIRFLSVEPMLGPVSVDPGIDWVICGCESGNNARPMEPIWAMSLRDQCLSANVPFFMKQMQIGGKLVKEINQFPEHMRIREVPST